MRALWTRGHGPMAEAARALLPQLLPSDTAMVLSLDACVCSLSSPAVIDSGCLKPAFGAVFTVLWNVLEYPRHGTCAPCYTFFLSPKVG
jgi:hypothetical protein